MPWSPPLDQVRRWQRVVPREVAEKQVRWERRHHITEAHRSGVTYREIAEHKRLSRALVHREGGIGYRNVVSPVENFMAMPLAIFVERTKERRFVECVSRLADLLDPRRKHTRNPNRDWMMI